MNDVHGITLSSHGFPFTVCGIRLSSSDTDLTFHNTPIEVTGFDVRISCPDCQRKLAFPGLKVVK